MRSGIINETSKITDVLGVLTGSGTSMTATDGTLSRPRSCSP